VIEDWRDLEISVLVRFADLVVHRDVLAAAQAKLGVRQTLPVASFRDLWA
jgi:hypothetical protein